MDENKFLTTDPFNRKIKLTNERWTNHIANRHGEHDVKDIQFNIEKPRYILQNMKPSSPGANDLVIDPDRQDYINIVLSDDGKIHGLKTIVHFTDKDSGYVVTSHILRNLKEIKTEGGVVYDSSKGTNSSKSTEV